VFEHLLGPGSFNSPERFITYKQTAFPIILGGIGLIPTSTIALTSYLRSWAFVALILVVRFMVNQHPFFLEALVQVDNNLPFPTTLQSNM
jgi:hypothetical protein